MGRIKTKLVKALTNDVFEKYSDEFTTDFEKNKAVVNDVQVGASTKLRNVIAGYATRLKKQQIKNQLE
ncbi:MAG: 30S ribosomal protein S17e [Candidatus Nanoarchaeia archaeon]